MKFFKRKAPDRSEAIRALRSSDDEEAALPQLQTALGDTDARVRHAAMEALGMLWFRGISTPTPALLAVIRDAAHAAEPALRAETAVALAIAAPMEAERSLGVVLELLEDESVLVRREAAAALGDLGLKQGIAPLTARLDDEDIPSRFEAAFALAMLGDDSGSGVLEASLADPKRRLEGLEAIRSLGNLRFVAPLQRLAARRLLPWPDRLMAWATLYRLGKTDYGARIAERLSAFNGQEAAMAIGLVGLHHIVEARTELERIVQDPKNRHQAIAADALTELENPVS